MEVIKQIKAFLCFSLCKVSTCSAHSHSLKNFAILCVLRFKTLLLSKNEFGLFANFNPQSSVLDFCALHCYILSLF